MNKMHAVITGASSGIGKALAVSFADAGYNLTLVARRKNLLEELKSALSVQCHLVTADLSNLETCTSWITESIKELGPIDVLVNNAGIQFVSPTLDVKVEDGEKLFRINVFAPMRLINAILPEMIKRNAGSIVNISSMSAITPTTYMYHYSASKAALGAASDTLHQEMKEFGVHVVTVYPGPVHTPMAVASYEKLDSRLAKFIPEGDPKTLASLILKAIKNKERRIIYPAIYKMARNFTPLSQWMTTTFAPKPKFS